MIVIAGKNNIAVHALNYLITTLKIDKNNIVVICNKTDFGEDSWQMSLKKRAKELSVLDVSLEYAELNASIFLSLEFDRLVKPVRFATDKLFNIHFSLLPKYKGMYTSIWPVLLGDNVSGTTLHRIDEGIDTGDIVAQHSFSFLERETSKDIYLKYINSAIKLFNLNIEKLLDGRITSVKQISKGSTYFSAQTIDFSCLKLDLNQTAWNIGRQIRAYSFRNYQLPKIKEQNVSNYEILDVRSSKRFGTLLDENELFFTVATVDYDIKLFKDKLGELFQLILSEKSQGDQVDLLLKNIPNINEKNLRSWSLLMVSVYCNDYNLSLKLIEKGADINALNYKHTSVLMYAKDGALNKNDNRLFRKLVSLGADIQHRDLLGNALEDYVSPEEMIFLLAEQ